MNLHNHKKCQHVTVKLKSQIICQNFNTEHHFDTSSKVLYVHVRFFFHYAISTSSNLMRSLENYTEFILPQQLSLSDTEQNRNPAGHWPLIQFDTLALTDVRGSPGNFTPATVKLHYPVPFIQYFKVTYNCTNDLIKSIIFTFSILSINWLDVLMGNRLVQRGKLRWL